MMKFNFYEAMRQYRLVAILRGLETDQVLPVAEALYEGGIRLLEVTMNTPEAGKQIAALVEHGEGKWFVGAGTVLDVGIAKEALSYGASYFITPNLDEDVVAFGIESGADVLPGVMTPTEIVRAYQTGARVVKLFPAGILGPGYLKELQGPLPNIPIVAVGGVSLDNAAQFMDAGAIGIGLGGHLLDKQAIKERNYSVITDRAKQFLQAVSYKP